MVVRRIAETFGDLATEVTIEREILGVFLELNPDVTALPNISPEALSPGERQALEENRSALEGEGFQR